jgi:hypothetical protein
MKKETNQNTSNYSPNTLESLLGINWSSMEPNKKIRKDGKTNVRNDSFYEYSPRYEETLEQAIENKFLTPSKFSLEIENIVSIEKMNYIDAICYYCETNNLDIESITKLISKPLKERIKWDAIRLNFMKKTSRAKLPL